LILDLVVQKGKQLEAWCEKGKTRVFISWQCASQWKISQRPDTTQHGCCFLPFPDPCLVTQRAIKIWEFVPHTWKPRSKQCDKKAAKQGSVAFKRGCSLYRESESSGDKNQESKV
jgi:hypothetical protein